MNGDKLKQYASDPVAFLDDLIIPGARGPVRFGDAMADFQRDRFAALAPALVAVARGECPPIGRFWWEASKGASKDSDLACCLLWLLAFATRPLDCQIGAADQDQADELRKAARDVLHLNGWLARRVAIQSWRIVCKATAAAAVIIAADVAGSHGARPDVLILNELSHVGKQEFAENLMDNSAKVPHGLAVVATNAGFVDTWQWKWRELARVSDRWAFHKWDKPAPWLDEDEIAEAKQRNSRSRYLRLWWGVWASGTGDALDPDDIAACVDASLGPMLGDEKDFLFTAGLDLGVKSDRSALAVVGVDGELQRQRLAALEAWAPGASGEVDLEAVKTGVLQAAWQFPLACVAYDPHQCEFMAQQLRREGVNMVAMPFSGRNLTIMAEVVLQVFRSRTLTMYPEPELLRDLGRLLIVEKSYGYKLDAPRDKSGHADRATALTIALTAGFQAIGDYVPPPPPDLPQTIFDLVARGHDF